MKKHLKLLVRKIFKICGYRVDFIKIKVNNLTTTIYNANKINLCCGTQKINGFIGVDITNLADIILDLKYNNLPFNTNSADVVICISAINYFTYERGAEIVSEVFRILKQGGIARFGVQDMESIAKRYINKDNDFFFQKLPNGSDRFTGPTIGDKFAAWFYGYIAGGYPCQYFYDFESLEYHFKKAGFSKIERKAFMESRIDEIEKIDNRQEQMFFLEAVK